MATVRKYRPYSWDNYSLGSSTINGTVTGVSSGTGTAIAVGDCREIAYETTYLVGSEPTQGVVAIEIAPNQDYTGVWTQIAQITCSNVPLGTDGQGVYPGPVEFARARFLTNADQLITVRINGLLG